jgi:hypothetical protein
VKGQISPEKHVDKGNLTAFIISLNIDIDVIKVEKRWVGYLSLLCSVKVSGDDLFSYIYRIIYGIL